MEIQAVTTSFIKKYPQNLVFILLIGLSLRLFVASDQYLHTWDERYHALVARHLADHPFKPTLYDNPVLPYHAENWVANHIWLEKGPVPLWSIAASIKLLGNDTFAVRVPSVIISILSIFLTFLLGRLLFNQRVGLIAAFFHSINGLLIELGGGRVSSDHVELFFIFLVQLGVYLSIVTINRKKGLLLPAFVGIVAGLAFLSKWSPALIIFPIWITGELLAKNKSKTMIFSNFLLSSLFFLFCILPWLFYINDNFHEEAHHVIMKFLNAYQNPVEEHTGPWYYYFQNIGMVYGEIIWIPIILSIFLIIKRRVGWQMIMISAWWMIPFIIFSFAATKRHTYLLISAPAIFTILAFALYHIHENAIFKKWIRITVLFLLVFLPIRYTVERVKPFKKVERNPQWVRELKQMNGKYKKNTIFVNSEHPIEGMFYTDYIFYGALGEEDIKTITDKGFDVIILPLLERQ